MLINICVKHLYAYIVMRNYLCVYIVTSGYLSLYIVMSDYLCVYIYCDVFIFNKLLLYIFTLCLKSAKGFMCIYTNG